MLEGIPSNSTNLVYLGCLIHIQLCLHSQGKIHSAFWSVSTERQKHSVMRLNLSNCTTFLLNLIVTTKFNARVSGWFVSAKHSRGHVLGSSVGRKEHVSSHHKGEERNKSNRTKYNRKLGLAAGWLGLHPAKTVVEISPSELAAGTQRVSLTWSPEPFFSHFIVVFMNVNSWLPLRDPHTWRDHNPRGEKQGKLRSCFFHRALWIHAPIQQPSHPLVSLML